MQLCISQLNVSLKIYFIMTTKTLGNDFMQRIADEGAWKELSRELGWTETLLEKYQDKIDWQELSENGNILWTVPMLQKFKHRINWDKLSRYADEKTLTENCIETFKEKWNWSELSENSSINNQLLEKFADKWVWEYIVDSYRSNLFSSDSAIEFYERYKEYIPATKLQGSNLWREIVEQRKKQILSEITA